MSQKFAVEVDFTQIPTRNLVLEGSPTPPTDTPKNGQLWNDTSIPNNSIPKCWDGDEWVRMDGGGDIPNGMIVDRHISATAAIAWSKIAHPADLATTEDLQTSIDDLSDSVDTRIADEATAREAADDDLSTRIDNLSTSLSGDYVTLATSQTVSGDKTFTGNVVVPVGDQPAEAVRLSQLTAEASRATAAEGGLDTRLQAVETAVEDVNNATQDELDTLAARVTGTENVNTTQTANIATLTSGLAAEVSRATDAEESEATDREAADDALGARIDAEASTRSAADTANANAVAAETTRATAAEGALGDRVTTLEGVDNLTQSEFNTFNTANTAALALKADLVGGKIPQDQIPAVSLIDIQTVADTDARDALIGSVQEGDMVVVTGVGTFVRNGLADDDAGAPESLWTEVTAPTGGASAADLAAEVAARTAADNALGVRIDTEHTHHTTAEAAIQADLNQEKLDRAAGDNTNATAITAEAARATAAEGVLDGRVDDEVARATDEENSIRSDFADADDVLNDAISAEVTRATAAEGTLTTNLGNEVTRATAAEAGLSSDISDVSTDLVAEVARATGVEAGQNTRITALENATTVDDLAALTARVTADESDIDDLQAADTALGLRIDTEHTHHTADRVALQAAIDAETAARTAGDSDEAAARASADTALGGRIDSEISNRATAETALGGRIDSLTTQVTTGFADETTARLAGDNAVRGEFAAADDDLRSDFESADAGLLTNINTRALDANVVHKAGTEEITGDKTFSGKVLVPEGTEDGAAVNVGQLHSYVSAEAYDDSALQDAIDAAQSDIDAFEATKGQANGLASLDADGKLPLSQLTSIRQGDVNVVADIAARDALTGMDEGDVAVVVDADGDGTRQSFIYDGTDWLPFSSPADVTDAELAASVAAGLASLEGGAGLTKTGNRFDVVGTANRVTVNADSVDIASTYVGQSSITTVGTVTAGVWNGTLIDLAHGGTGYAATSKADLVDYLGIQAPALGLYAETLTGMVEGTEFEVTHNLGGTDVITQVRGADGNTVFADVRVIDEHTVGVLVDSTYVDGDSLRLTVIGGPVDGTGHSEGRAWSGRAWS